MENSGGSTEGNSEQIVWKIWNEIHL